MPAVMTLTDILMQLTREGSCKKSSPISECDFPLLCSWYET